MQQAPPSDLNCIRSKKVATVIDICDSMKMQLLVLVEVKTQRFVDSVRKMA